jgi:predicted acetyltransferase
MRPTVGAYPRSCRSGSEPNGIPVPGAASMSQSVQLVKPGFAFCDSYRGLVAEFAAAGEQFVPFVLAFEHDNFAAFLARLDACARGIDLPNGFVAHSTYWLVRDQGEVVGVSNIRHSLTSALRREGGNIGYGIRPSARRRGFGATILRKSVDRAGALGLSRVLVTCAKANVGSVKAILRNGGILESEEYLADRGELVQRYWIESGSNAGT